MTELVRYLNNQNEVSEELCEMIESKGKFCRIKTPQGQILRIFNDRIRFIDKAVNDNTEINSTEQWIKTSRINDSMTCDTIICVNRELGNYLVTNSYNGIDKKSTEYELKDYDKLIKRLIKKGYTRQEKR